MSLLKDLQELVSAEVISESSAEKIKAYYREKNDQSNKWLFTVFGVLGAILAGLGIILILAHNWDDLSRLTKTIIAFLPLLLGQLLAIYIINKKFKSDSWRESAAAFIFFAVASSISLVSQIYHIAGDFSSFLLSWMLLCLPLVYLMKSSIVSLLYLIGITYYAVEAEYWSYPAAGSYLYWFLLIALLPHYYLLFKERPKSNFISFHHWLIPISVTITLGIFAAKFEELMVVAYMSLFGSFYFIGTLDYFNKQKTRNNGYKVLGALGTITLLLALSFDPYWKELRRKEFLFSDVLGSPEFIVMLLLTLFAALLLAKQVKKRSLKNLKPFHASFIIFLVIFLIGLYSSVSLLLVNLMVLAIGIYTIREGAKTGQLTTLNYGLLIISALVICRFFDTDISFIVKGMLFMLVGVGFFVTNYLALKKRKAHEE